MATHWERGIDPCDAQLIVAVTCMLEARMRVVVFGFEHERDRTFRAGLALDLVFEATEVEPEKRRCKANVLTLSW